MSNKSLTVIDQQEVTFYEDKLPAAIVENGEIYVPLRPICEFLGISWATQRGRVNRDAVLSEVVRRVLMKTPGGRQTLVSMRCFFLVATRLLNSMNE